VRRPLSKDASYARELGLVGTHISRTIQRLGGAAKLRALDPETRAVLLKQATGLTITRRVPAAMARPPAVERNINREIRRILRERGLIK
jgi:hypothetical protein